MVRSLLKKSGGRNLLGTGLSPIAAEFGTTELRILQVTGHAPRSLVAAASVPTPEALLHDPSRRLAWQLDQLPRTIKRCGFKGRRGVCVMPASRTFCKHLQFARSEGVTTQALVEAALPAELGCTPNALVVRALEVEGVERGGRQEVICLATPRELVSKCMTALNQARITPVGMLPEFQALLGACGGVPSDDAGEQGATVYLDLGYSATRVAITHQGKLVFARTIELGGRHLDEAVMNQLRCTPAEARAERLKVDAIDPQKQPQPAAAAPEPDGLAALNAAMRQAGRQSETKAAEPRAAARPVGPRINLKEPMEMLTDEISMCFRYHDSVFPGRKVSQGVIVGGEATHRAVCEHLAKTLRISARTADPMASIARTGREPADGVDLSKPMPGWAMVLGACLSQTDL